MTPKTRPIRLSGPNGRAARRARFGIEPGTPPPNANATQQSENRLLKSNHVFRVSQGLYAYTAPLFGDFVRRKYARQLADR